ncbi:hypothetical protein BU25DRAFT_414862 [Macroventuria anomochaeta]|uniref:Uncharacterized protein n=1 Tax=Macroventuria anomochaeta TaxID=301207 RepID=A0ACB6RLY3_9PLEO|nr:uncharacterized protein BU25DRAFT_414862 [Macroventuria anomochaeta]KAF2622876.1 hypothetical protein BU25DRAFT_414862 [Macroventuria anomochaeta]
MPPALDRLLASPSALKLLRSIVTAPELPACHTTIQCCAAKSIAAKSRTYAKSHGVSTNRKWKRWNEQKAIVSERETVLKALLGDDVPAEIDSTPAQPPEQFGLLRDDDKLVESQDEKPLQEFGFPRDDEEHSAEGQDETWAAKLAHHERLDGLRGVQAVWNARRKEGYRLPVENSAHAQSLWGTFARHPQLVQAVIEHAAELQQEKGETYPRVYSLIMGYWLVRKPTDALEYHHQMLVKLRPRTLPLRELARSTRNYGHTALEALLYIYRNSNERDLYGEIVPRLIDCGNIKMARRWHNLCTFRDDLPSESLAAHPVIQIFTAESSALSNPNVRFDKTKRENPNLNKDLMRRLLGRDTAPVRFEDSFTARMFATRTVQTESIIKGLAMVGVNEIGPQAVSALAWRTQPITDLPRRFGELRAAGIALQGSVFSLALEKFAMERKWDLVHSILESDQHPDVYGDADTQRSLLTYYLEQKDLKQAQRTLAILTLFHNDASRESWNLLLQLRIGRSTPRDVFNTLLEMRSHGLTVSSVTMASVRDMLSRRQRGHRPSSRRGFDDLRFVTRFYIAALETGMARVPPEAWHEIIRRFGMQSRFRELKRLLLWLLSWYAPQHSSEFADLPRSTFFDDATNKLRRSYPINRHYYNFPADVTQEQDERHPVRALFPPSFQQGILVWGFRASLLRAAPLEQSILGSIAAKRHHRRNLLRKGILKRLNWNVGLKLLVQLRDLNVHIHPHTVTKALQAQFINLFGHGHSRIKANRIMEQSNTTPYAEYVREVNRVWGSPLLTEPHKLGFGKLDGHLWHPRLRRRADRKKEVSLKQAMGEQWGYGRKIVKKEHGHGDGDALEELAEVVDAHAKGKKG